MDNIIKINNKPESADHYEFVVAREFDDAWWFWGAYKDGYKAAKAAQEINGVVFHNVRIQGYQP